MPRLPTILVLTLLIAGFANADAYSWNPPPPCTSYDEPYRFITHYDWQLPPLRIAIDDLQPYLTDAATVRSLLAHIDHTEMPPGVTRLRDLLRSEPLSIDSLSTEPPSWLDERLAEGNKIALQTIAEDSMWTLAAIVGDAVADRDVNTWGTIDEQLYVSGVCLTMVFGGAPSKSVEILFSNEPVEANVGYWFQSYRFIDEPFDSESTVIEPEEDLDGF